MGVVLVRSDETSLEFIGIRCYFTSVISSSEFSMGYLNLKLKLGTAELRLIDDVLYTYMKQMGEFVGLVYVSL